MECYAQQKEGAEHEPKWSAWAHCLLNEVRRYDSHQDIGDSDIGNTIGVDAFTRLTEGVAILTQHLNSY